MDENDFQDLNSKKNKKIYIINIALIIAIFIALFIYLITVEGLENIKTLLNSANYLWVLAGFVCLLGMWLAEAISIHLPLKKLYPSQKLANSFKITMIGQLFNNITPFASGGQPLQAYIMYKEGKRPSNTLSILTMRFAITQTILIVFTILVVLSQFSFFSDIFRDYVWLGIVGIIVNVLLVIAIVLAGTNKNLVMKIAKPFIYLGSKIHIGKFRFIKDKESTTRKFDESVSNFSNQFRNLQKEKGLITLMALLGFVQSVFYYGITYMVYRTFGNYGATFLQIITTQAFLMLLMSVFPTPGAGLGAEGGFLLLFSSIFQNGTINLSILFWRIYVFYLPIIFGTLFFVPAFRKSKEKL